MFSGLVQSLAEIVSFEPEGPGARVVVRAPAICKRSELGASIAVNGCCLTVVELVAGDIAFQAGEETLSRTNLGELQTGDVVNLETSLRVGDELGGHFVTGHVDGVGDVVERSDDGDWTTMWFHVAPELARQLASKGSVAIDGVSLTLVGVEEDRFSVALIPHTLSATTLGRRKVGDRVNVETDVLAKYIERQLAVREARPTR